MSQPTHPDKFDYLEQDAAGDQDSDTYIPPDEPMGSHAYGTTLAEERAGETFDERTKHTNSEVFDDETGPTDPSEGEAVGRLVQPGDEAIDAVDEESNTVASEDGEMDDLTAEESAMHITDVP